MAAVLACGDEALLSRRTAAELWCLLEPSSKALEVSRPGGGVGPKTVIVHRCVVPEDERDVVEGIPVTSVCRTVCDLAAVVSRSRLERAFNEMEVSGLTDRLSIPDLMRRYPRRPGTVALRSLLEEGQRCGVTRSELEERFLALLAEHALPRPRLNADLRLHDRFVKPDAIWGDARLIVELDGRAVHGTRRAFERDRKRDRLLLAEGWRVVRITWRQLRDEPEGVVADLRALLLPCRGEH